MISDLHKALHKILESYINGHKTILSKTESSKDINMRVVCERLKINLSPNFVEGYLVEEYKYLERIEFGDQDKLFVTDAGKFFWSQGGFLKHIKDAEEEAAIKELDKTIKVKTINKFKYDRAAFWMSFIGVPVSLIIGIIGLVSNLQTKSDTIDLKVKLNTLSTDIYLQKNTLDSLSNELGQVKLGRSPTKFGRDSISSVTE